jgi:hypothetical protein
MTTDYHTPHSFAAPLSSAEINGPLAELDAAISTHSAGMFNVKDYGAVGNGVADDYAACQAAVNAATAAGGGGGIVFFPPGTYKLSVGLTMGRHVSIRGSGQFTTTLAYSGATGPVIDYPDSGLPASDANYSGFFTLRDFQVTTGGSLPGLRITKGQEFHLANVRIGGEPGATGNGVELLDCFSYTVADLKVRSFPSGTLLKIIPTTVNSGGATFNRITLSTGLIGLDLGAGGTVGDTYTFIDFGVTNATQRAISMTGSFYNVSFFNTHLELTNNAANTATGIYQSGAGFTNVVFDGLFLWGMQTPVNITGTVNGLRIENVYANSVGVASPGALITTGASVTGFELGFVAAMSTYTAIVDGSSQATRRKRFAGARTVQTNTGITLTLTNVNQDTGVTVTITPTYDEVWEVTGVIDFSISVAGVGLCAANFVFDGVAASNAAFYDPGGGVGRSTVPVHGVFFAAAGVAHTLKIVAKKSTGVGTAVTNATHTNMLLRRSGIGA